MKKAISIAIICGIIVMLFSVCAFAAVNVEYEFNETDGYVYITVSPQQSNYKFMLSGNYSIFNYYSDALSWQWKLTHNGSTSQTNANWWALFPVVTRQIDSRTLDMQGVDLSELRNYEAECKVTYTVKGFGIEQVDDFVPIDIYSLKKGYLTVNDIKTNVSGQEIQETDKIKKRETIYYWDEVEEYATITYTVYSPEFDNLNDIIFLKHNASITYEEDITLIIIPDLTIKLSYSEAQRLINEMKVQTGLLKEIRDALIGEESSDEETSKIGEEISEYEETETSIIENMESYIDDVDRSIPSEVKENMAYFKTALNSLYTNEIIIMMFTIVGAFVVLSMVIYGRIR